MSFSKQTATYTATVPLQITPSDSINLSLGTCRALYVGTGGNISITGGNGVPIVFNNVADSFILPVQATRVNATGTTATDIIALH
jgi:hypothetical protein